ncbi:TolB family protein [Shimazuella kribbensis]|uniref:TolB family protein n=1 Tax=Shimazuella kribbensis TaxID=139808 RepID=UPI0004279BF2|nr:DPP IV N-terminal domain-containing protein [Shimazuella kribbensis]
MDLSPDDSHFVFSHRQGEFSSIYTSNSSGLKVVRLTFAKKGEFHINPTYSPNGEQIAFISSSSDRTHSPLFLMSKDGTRVRQLTGKNTMVQETIFSADGKKIYFVQAKRLETQAGYPIPTDLDLYSFDLAENRMQQLTHWNESSLYNLRLMEAGKKLIFIKSSNIAPHHIIFSLDLSTPEKKVSDIKPNITMNGSGILSFAISDKSALAFTVEFNNGNTIEPRYDIYLTDLHDRPLYAEPLATTFYHVQKFYHHSNKILLTPHGDEFFQYEMDTGKFFTGGSIRIPLNTYK